MNRYLIMQYPYIHILPYFSKNYKRWNYKIYDKVRGSELVNFTNSLPLVINFDKKLQITPKTVRVFCSRMELSIACVQDGYDCSPFK